MRLHLLALLVGSSVFTGGLALAAPPPLAAPSVHLPTPPAPVRTVPHATAASTPAPHHTDANGKPAPVAQRLATVRWGHAAPDDVSWAKQTLAEAASPRAFLQKFWVKVRTSPHGDPRSMPGNWKAAASAAEQLLTADLRKVETFAELPPSLQEDGPQNPSAVERAVQMVLEYEPGVVKMNYNQLRAGGRHVPEDFAFAHDLVAAGIDPTTVRPILQRHREEQARPVQVAPSAAPVAVVAQAPANAPLPAVIHIAPVAVAPAPAETAPATPATPAAEGAGAPARTPLASVPRRPDNTRLDSAVRASLNASGNKLSSAELEGLKRDVGSLVDPPTVREIDRRLAAAYLREGTALNAERLTLLKRGLLGHLGSLGGKLTPRDVAEVRELYEVRRGSLPREAQQELETGLAGFEAKARAAGHP